MEPALNSPSPPIAVGPGQAEPRWRGGWQARVLTLALLAAVVITLLAWILGTPSHKASSYGIVDPSSAALRVENRTTDFAIARVLIGEPESGIINQKVHHEIGPGAGAAIELEPGDYLLEISWVEIAQVEAFVPKGELTERIDLSAGEAAVLHLQGGRWASDGLLCIPPKLVVR